MITSLSMLLNTDFGFWTFMNGCLWIIFCLDLFWLYNIVKMSVCLVFNNKLVDIREGKYKCNSNDIKTKSLNGLTVQQYAKSVVEKKKRI
ncbi:hypothetical protein GJ496_009175 [Pomphorhynchus laevis]|nr:hypothetical protein GJ496_009175 [Pomphorhynchus laevis]